MRSRNWIAAFAVIAIFFLSAQSTKAHTLIPPVGSAGVAARPLPVEPIHATSRTPSTPSWDVPIASNCTQTGVNAQHKPIEACCPPPGVDGSCAQLDATGPIQLNPDGTVNPEVCYAIWEGESTVSFDCYYENDPS